MKNIDDPHTNPTFEYCVQRNVLHEKPNTPLIFLSGCRLTGNPVDNSSTITTPKWIGDRDYDYHFKRQIDPNTDYDPKFMYRKTLVPGPEFIPSPNLLPDINP